MKEVKIQISLLMKDDEDFNVAEIIDYESLFSYKIKELKVEEVSKNYTDTTITVKPGDPKDYSVTIPTPIPCVTPVVNRHLTASDVMYKNNAYTCEKNPGRSKTFVIARRKLGSFVFWRNPVKDGSDYAYENTWQDDMKNASKYDCMMDILSEFCKVYDGTVEVVESIFKAMPTDDEDVMSKLIERDDIDYYVFEYDNASLKLAKERKLVAIHLVREV